MNLLNPILVCTIAALAAILSGSRSAHAEPPPRSLAMSCFTCHGPAGKSPDAIPSINGKNASFIEANMKAFRSGKRQSTVMQRIAKGYTDREIKALAGYIANLK